MPPIVFRYPQYQWMPAYPVTALDRVQSLFDGYFSQGTLTARIQPVHQDLAETGPCMASFMSKLCVLYASSLYFKNHYFMGKKIIIANSIPIDFY